MFSCCCGKTEDEGINLAILEEQPRKGKFSPEELHCLEVEDKEPRLILISDQLPEYNLLCCALKKNVIPVVVRYNDWSLEDLHDAIEDFGGSPERQFASVALLDHGAPGRFGLLKEVGDGDIDLKEVETSTEIQNFFKFLGGYVRAPRRLHKWRSDLQSRIDLLACSVAGSEEGMKLITFLEDLTHVNWAASVDKTGNVGDGYDWDMETETGLEPVNSCYFLTHKLQEWNHCAWWNPVRFVKDRAQDVAEGISHVVQKVAGSRSYYVHNNLAVPAEVVYSLQGGAFPEPHQTLKPGDKSSACKAMPPGQYKTCWVCVDGKNWYYQDYQGGDPPKYLRVRQVIEHRKGVQGYVGFDITNAGNGIVEAFKQFAETCAGEAKTLLEEALKAFKAAIDQSGIDSISDFKKPERKPVSLKDYAKRNKKGAKKAGKKYKQSRDGLTVFESFYNEKDVNDSEPSGQLHSEIHTLRESFEDIRFTFVDLHDSIEDMRDMLATPKQMKQDANTMRNTVKKTKTVMSKVKCGGGGPVGAIVNAAKTSVERGLEGIGKGIQKTETRMEKFHNDHKLDDKSEKLRVRKEQLRAKVLFKLEKVNHKLAKMEQKSQRLTQTWEKKKDKAPEEIVESVEGGITKASDSIGSLNRKLQPVSKNCDTTRGCMGVGHKIVETKREIRKTYIPVTNLLNKLGEVLVKLYEMVLKPILELPVIKDILEFISSLIDWVINKVMEITRLDQLADWLGEKLNPFNFAEEMASDLKEALNIDLDPDVLLEICDEQVLDGIVIPKIPGEEEPEEEDDPE